MSAPKNKYLALFDDETPPAGQNLLAAGIASSQKGYRLAWQLNTLPGMALQRTEDLFFRHRKGQDIYIQCYEHTDDEYGHTYRLVGNRTSNNILIPEHKNTDYFLLVKGGMEEKEWTQLLARMKRLTFALAVYEINFDTLKNKDILYF